MPDRPRFRFSLLNVIFLMTCVGMGLGLWRTQAELGPLRREVVQLRNEAGHLTIEDPKRLHAIEVETGNPLIWKWKIHLPEHKQYTLWTRVGTFAPRDQPPGPKEGAERLVSVYPQYRGDGPHELVVSVYRDDEGKTVLRRKMPGVSSQMNLTDKQIERLTKKRSWTHGGVVRHTQHVEKGEPLVLLRSVMKLDGETFAAGEPERGLLIWLEEFEP